jgi:23S rRNA pseudouridine1911/1915/1917 synthase
MPPDRQLYTADAGHEGMRCDAFLAEVSPHSRARIAGLIKLGHVTLNGDAVQARDRVREGMTFALVLPEAKKTDMKPQDLPIDIVYEDNVLAVINKPRGLVVHPGAGIDSGTLVHALLFHMDDLSTISGEIRPGIVHRLDKDTTGLLLIAKSDEAHRSLSAQIQSRKVKREYAALVYGNIAEDEGIVDAPIGRHRRDRKRMAVVRDGREARTHFRVLCRYGDTTLVHLTLDTGRTHQIRVHMAHISHPVVFDPVYGIKKERDGKKGQLLHAFRLSFFHPVTGERLVFCAPLPQDFLAVLRHKGEVPALF